MNNPDAVAAAARQLAMRPLTEKLLRDKLAEKEFAEDDIEEAVAKMRDIGALNDAAYAADFAQSRALRGWGAIRIKHELKRRGAGEDDIEAALETLDDPSDAIVRIIEQKSKGEPIDRVLKQKIAASLMRKGFAWQEIKEAFERFKNDE